MWGDFQTDFLFKSYIPSKFKVKQRKASKLQITCCYWNYGYQRPLLFMIINKLHIDYHEIMIVNLKVLYFYDFYHIKNFHL